MQNKMIYLTAIMFLICIVFSGCSGNRGYTSSRLIVDVKGMDHFDAEVIDSSGKVAVVFYTTVNPTCTKISPILDELAEELEGNLKVVTVNCRRNNDLLLKYEIDAVPRFVFFEDGEVVEGPVMIDDADELRGLFAEHV
ncbi:MAG: thioredoxin family protein [Candidatus Omnitrophota bacterium]